MTETCVPTLDSNSCAVYQGKMTLFLADKQLDVIAEYVALSNLKEIVEQSTIVESIKEGLVKITYMGPAPVAPYGLLDAVDDSSSSMNGAAVAVMTAGAGAVLLLLAAMFAWRRKGTKESMDLAIYEEAISQAGQSSLHGLPTESDEEHGPSPSSPFSEMLPSAYRYSENMSILSGQGLSAVTEVTESDGTQSINISLSGFSEDNGGDEVDGNVVEMPESLVLRSQSVSPCLTETDRSSSSELHCETSSDNYDGEDYSSSDDSPKESEPQTKSSKPAAMTSLLLGIASPKNKLNTSSHDDEALLFLS